MLPPNGIHVGLLLLLLLLLTTCRLQHVATQVLPFETLTYCHVKKGPLDLAMARGEKNSRLKHITDGGSLGLQAAIARAMLEGKAQTIDVPLPSGASLPSHSYSLPKTAFGGSLKIGVAVDGSKYSITWQPDPVWPAGHVFLESWDNVDYYLAAGKANPSFSGKNSLKANVDASLTLTDIDVLPPTGQLDFLLTAVASSARLGIACEGLLWPDTDLFLPGTTLYIKNVRAKTIYGFYFERRDPTGLSDEPDTVTLSILSGLSDAQLTAFDPRPLYQAQVQRVSRTLGLSLLLTRYGLMAVLLALVAVLAWRLYLKILAVPEGVEDYDDEDIAWLDPAKKAQLDKAREKERRRVAKAEAQRLAVEEQQRVKEEERLRAKAQTDLDFATQSAALSELQPLNELEASSDDASRSQHSSGSQLQASPSLVQAAVASPSLDQQHDVNSQSMMSKTREQPSDSFSLSGTSLFLAIVLFLVL